MDEDTAVFLRSSRIIWIKQKLCDLSHGNQEGGVLVTLITKEADKDDSQHDALSREIQ